MSIGTIFINLYAAAHEIDSEEQIYKRNLERAEKLLYEANCKEISNISESITMDELGEIGYTTELCRQILSIQDPELKNIILRDVKECAIAIVARQDKMATIMCGSIIEALLMNKISEMGIDRYDIPGDGENKDRRRLREMTLNDLLLVAEKENILQKNSFHLGHYIRDYRNVVHPAKELRMKEEISHENVLTMWSVLKRILKELYPISYVKK